MLFKRAHLILPDILVMSFFYQVLALSFLLIRDANKHTKHYYTKETAIVVFLENSKLESL